MNLKRLLLLTVAIFSLLAINVSFAKTIRISKELADEIIKLQEEAKKSSGEAIETSGEKLEAESGEKIEAESGEVAEVVSGDKIEAKSGEAIETSGEKLEAVSGEVAEVVSGEKVEAVSGEVAKSGDEVIVTAKAKDIEASKWYAPYVKNVVKKGIMELDEEGNFNPMSKVTKQDVIDAIYNLPGLKAEEEEWAKDNKIVAEGEDLSAEATREDIAVTIYNYVKSYGGGFKGTWMFMLGYSDKDEISKEAYESVAWCVMNDIIIGKTDDTLNIQDVATRAELATIIYRINK